MQKQLSLIYLKKIFLSVLKSQTIPLLGFPDTLEHILRTDGRTDKSTERPDTQSQSKAMVS